MSEVSLLLQKYILYFFLFGYFVDAEAKEELHGIGSMFAHAFQQPSMNSTRFFSSKFASQMALVPTVIGSLSFPLTFQNIWKYHEHLSVPLGNFCFSL